MSDNIVYEIQQMMQDKNIIRKDMSDAMSLVQDMFYKKYFSGLINEIQTHKAAIHERPPREVQLMKALKEFRPKEEHGNIEQLIEMMALAGSLKKLQDQFKVIKSSDIEQDEISIKEIVSATVEESKQDSSIHPDGIYDIDTSCLAEQPKDFSFLLAFAMAMRNSHSS